MHDSIKIKVIGFQKTSLYKYNQIIFQMLPPLLAMVYINKRKGC